ncbi:MAG: conserved hypothetical protein (putative transposase or invertase) [Glomeribacter sp. 1016415]|nr:conserved hypothetical protein (putative transposase or invertase) [Glomeribacter sp. 1016415]
MKKLSMPHDALFKSFLKDIDIAQEFLQLHLPCYLQKECDFNTLQLVSGAFVQSNLSQRFADIVYSVSSPDGQDKLYILMEHESTASALPPFKLSSYLNGIMQQHLEQGHKQLPAVFEMIFYRGERPYPGPTNYLNCFKRKQLAQKRLGLPASVKILDLSTIPDEEIKRYKRMAALTLAQKYIGTQSLMQFAPQLAELLQCYPLPVEKLRQLIYYLVEEGRGDDGQFLQFLMENVRQCREDEEMKTLGQFLRDEGREEGREEGRREGWREGQRKGEQLKALAIAQNLQNLGLELDTIKRVTGLSDLKGFA